MAEVKPFLKWVGGKRQLLPHLLPLLKDMGCAEGRWRGRYYEPFLGGGAALFALSQLPGFTAVANDSNAELINVYRCVKTDPQGILRTLEGSPFSNTQEAFTTIRAWDREETWSTRTPLERAARFIYLNRTGFNGVWRVNRKGHFNVPFGRSSNPGFPSEATLLACSQALACVELKEGDFEACLEGVCPGDVVYFDPPYIPVSASANFTGYTAQGFDGSMQERLAALCDRLTLQGVNWIVSNANVPLAHTLFGRQPGSIVHTVTATRALNRDATKRGPVGEIIAFYRAPRAL